MVYVEEITMVSTSISAYLAHGAPPKYSQKSTVRMQEEAEYMLRPVNKTDHMQQGINVPA